MFTVSNTRNRHHKTRAARRALMATSALVSGALTVALGAGPAQALDDYATPYGEQVAGGSADFSRPQTGVLNVDQHSDRVVIDWTRFDIGAKAKTEFFQPGSESLAVNRVTGAGDPTQILGTLKANGKLMILDRNGVFFGAGARIDVGGIIASTGEISTSAVMNGDTVFNFDNFGNGEIVNYATINVADAGLAAFVAPTVRNYGVINAKLGKVAFAAGAKVTLDLYGDQLIEIAVDDKAEEALLENAGTINAEGGTVLMTAQAAKTAVDNVINMSGIINASSATQDGGKIVLSGGGQGTVSVSGNIDASGAGAGGEIGVDGQNITLAAGSNINADGAETGGTVRIYAKEEGEYEGAVTARGGETGYVETSAATLAFAETASILTDFWLIDPVNVDVDAVMAGLLVGQLDAGGDAFVTTSHPGTDAGDLTVSSAIVWSGKGSLILFADNDMAVNANIASSYAGGNGTKGAVSLHAGAALIVNADITTDKGDILLTASNVDMSVGSGADPNKLMVNALVRSERGDITLANNRTGGATWSNNNGVHVGASASVETGTGDITISSDLNRTIIQGTVKAGNTGNKNVTIDTHTLQMWGNGVIEGRTVTIDADSAVKQFSATNAIIANMLTGSAGGSVTLDGQNEIVKLDGFASSGTFTLNDVDGSGLRITGDVTTTNDDIGITTNGGSLRLDSGVTVASTGGAIDLENTDGAVDIYGTVDATGSDSSIALEGTSVNLKNGSVVKTEDGTAPYTGALSIVATDGSITQHVNSTIETASLTGSATRKAQFKGTANIVGEVQDFTTGNDGTGGVAANNGGFTLEDNGGVVVSGTVSTLGGAVDIYSEGASWDQQTKIGGSVVTNGGAVTLGNNKGNIIVANGGLIDAGTTGAITFENDAATQLWNGSTVKGRSLTVTGHQVSQNAGSVIEVGTLSGSLLKYATFAGTANKIGTLGDLQVGTADWYDDSIGLTVVDSEGGLRITGSVGSTGGDIDISTSGTAASEKLNVTGAGSVTSQGGGITLTNAGSGVSISGTVDATGSAGNVTLSGTELAFSGGSTVKAGTLDLTATAGDIRQNGNGTMEAETLTGSSYGETKLTSINNDFGALDAFSTGNAGNDEGGFGLVDGAGGLNVSGAVTTEGGDIDVGVAGALALQSGGSFDAKGGDIDLYQTGAFSSVDDDSVTTSGDGDITLHQNVGGSIQNAVDAINNTGTGDSTLNVGAGVYTENITIDKSMTLVGQAGATLQAAAGNIITVTASDVTIDPFIFDGLGTAAYGIHAAGPGAVGLVVDGNTFKRFTDAGIYVSGNSAGTGIIDNNIFEGSAMVGVEAGTLDGGYVLDLEDNTFGSNGDKLVHGVKTGAIGTATLNVTGGSVDSSGDGIRTGNIGSGASVTLKNLDVEAGDEAVDVQGNVKGTLLVSGGTLTGAGSGFEVNGVSGAVTIKNAAVTGQHATDGQGINVLGNVSGDLDVTNSTVTGGMNGIGRDGGTFGVSGTLKVTGGSVTGVSGNGIDVGDVSGTVNITNVDVTAGGTGINVAGEFSGGTSKVIIKNNHVLNAAAGDGISVVDTTLGGLGTLGISGNIIEKTGDDGIAVENVSRGTISGNYIGYSDAGVTPVAGGLVIKGDGISVTGSEGVNVTGNSVINAKMNGVLASGSKNMTVSGNAVENSGNANRTGGISVRDVSENVKVRNNVILNSGWDGIYVQDSTGTNVTGNTVTGTSESGITVQFGGKDTLIKGNTVSGGRRGVLTKQSNNTTIEGNIVYNQSMDGIYAISGTGIVIDGNDVGYTDAGVTAGTAGNIAGDGIHASDTDGVRITGNDIVSVGANGIFVEDSALAVVKTNDVQGTDAGTGILFEGSDNGTIGGMNPADGNTVSHFASGIVLEDSDGASVHNNTITQVADYGIRLFGGSHEFNMQLNEITDPSVGISIEDATNTVVALVEDNTITGVDTGIAVSNSTNVQLIDNDITGNSVTGIDVSGGSNIEIEDNTIDHFDTGIKVIGTAGAEIDNNEITDVDYGIWADNVSDLNIEDNDIDAGWNPWNGEIGIYVEDSYDARIGGWNAGNEVQDFRTGIMVVRSDSADIEYNDVDDTYTGISVVNSADVDVKRNDISDAYTFGVYLYNTDNVEVEDNEIFTNNISDTDYGIYLSDSGPERTENALIDDNKIDDVDVGIYADDVDGLVITDNDIDAGHGLNAGNIGIYVEDSRNVEIGGWNAGNEVEDFDTGIRVHNSTGADVEYNVVTEIGSEHGIYVSGSDFADIMYNEVDGAGKHGIYVNPSDDVEIVGNTVWSSGWDGIRVDGGDDAEIIGNYVYYSGDDGIDVRYNDDVRIHDNYIYETGLSYGDGNGIVVEGNFWNDNADIRRNEIWYAGGDGIDVRNSRRADIRDNEVYWSQDDGIDVSGSAFVDVNDNLVEGTSWGNGIEVTDSFDADILNNIVTAAGESGIDVRNSEGVDIIGNIIHGYDFAGIRLSRSDNAKIGENDIYGIELSLSGLMDLISYGDLGQYGIYAERADGLEVYDNVVAAQEEDGILVRKSGWTTVSDNIVLGTGGHGISVWDGRETLISNNVVTATGLSGLFGGSWGDGIHVGNSNDTTIENNLIMLAGRDGIRINGGRNVDILNNQIALTGNDGIHVEDGHGKGKDTVTIDGNQIVLTGGDGIEIKRRGYTEVTNNDIFAAGIGFEGLVTGTQKITFEDLLVAPNAGGLDISLTAGFEWGDAAGIKVSNVNAGGGYDALISGNSVAWTGGHGVLAEDMDAVKVSGNDISWTGIDETLWDISFSLSASDLQMLSSLASGVISVLQDTINEIQNGNPGYLGDGIRFVGNGVEWLIGSVNIAEGLQMIIPAPDDLSQSEGDGVHITNVGFADIRENEIANAGDDGIDSEHTAGTTTTLIVYDNIIDDSLDNGLEVSESDNTFVKDNLITTSGAHGVFIEGTDNGNVMLAGNILTDNPVAMRFQSGIVDMAYIEEPNEIYGGEIGLWFDQIDSDPYSLQLIDYDPADDFAGTIGSTIFNMPDFAAGYTPEVLPATITVPQYVYLTGGALYESPAYVGTPAIYNALDATYYTGPATTIMPRTTAGVLTQGQFDFLEARFFHWSDLNTLGLFFFGYVPSEDGTTIAQEDVFRNIDLANLGTTGYSVTVLALPNIPGAAPFNLNALAPNAGGTGEDGELTPEEAALFEPAAGGEQAGCWSDAMNMAGGGTVVNYSYGGTLEENLGYLGGCQGGAL